MKKWILFLAIAAFGVNMLWAQKTNKDNSKTKNTAKDNDFVTKALESSIAEVELGKLALKNAHHQEVKDFARMMIDDHERVNLELTQLANQNGYQDIPHQTSFTFHNKQQKMQNLKGENFDQAYIDEMVKSHQEAVELFRKQSRMGNDDSIKSWALKNLPVLEKHLEHAKDLQKNYKND